MKPLAANLKHLYQRPAVWVWYLLFLIFIPMTLLLPLKAPGTEGVFASYLILSVLGGVLAVSLQLDILCKPFSFCMPGCRKIPGKFIFIIGAAINAPASFLYLGHPDLDPALAPVSIFAAFCFGMFTFSGFAWAVFGFKNIGFIGFLPAFVFVFSLVSGPEFIETIILHSPLFAIVLGTVSSIGLWKWLGNDMTYRNVCGKRMISFFDGWNRVNAKKFMDAKRAERWQKKEIKELTGAERFFQSKIESRGFASKPRYIWSMLYSDCSNFLNLGRQKILLSILYFCLLIFFIAYVGYYPMGLSKLINMFAIIPTLYYVGAVPTTMLLTLGRRERCFGHFFMIAVIAVGVTILIAVASIALVALSKILPDIHLKGQTLVFQSPDLRFMYVPLLIMPLGFTLRTLFPKTSVIGIPLIMIVFLFGHSILGWLNMQHPVLIMMIMIGAWLVLNLATRYRFMRSCFAGQR